jgi:hypothetical protein
VTDVALVIQVFSGAADRTMNSFVLVPFVDRRCRKDSALWLRKAMSTAQTKNWEDHRVLIRAAASRT